VGTLTEFNDHIKLLFARAARIYCRQCGRPVGRDTPESIFERLMAGVSARDEDRALITFPVEIPENFSEQEVMDLLARQGYTRMHRKRGEVLEVVQDRLRLSPDRRDRIVEALESALRVGHGGVGAHPLDGPVLRFSANLHWKRLSSGQRRWLPPSKYRAYSPCPVYRGGAALRAYPGAAGAAPRQRLCCCLDRIDDIAAQKMASCRTSRRSSSMVTKVWMLLTSWVRRSACVPAPHSLRLTVGD